VIPFIVDSLYEKCKMELVNLIEDLDKLMTNRKSIQSEHLYSFHDKDHSDNLTLLYNNLKSTIIEPMGL